MKKQAKIKTFSTLGDLLLKRYVVDFIANVQELNYPFGTERHSLYEDIWYEHDCKRFKFYHKCPKVSSYLEETYLNTCHNCGKLFPEQKKLETIAKMKEFKHVEDT